MMTEEFEIFLEDFGPQFDARTISVSDKEEFHGRLPANLLSYLGELGFGGFSEGIFWLTNPDDYRGVIAAWLEQTNLRSGKDFFPIARNAFGSIFLWSPSRGASVTIHPLTSSVVISRGDSLLTSEDRRLEFTAFLLAQEVKRHDFEDAKGQPLFKRALKKLGRLKYGEMYGFEPALCAGGSPTLDNLVRLSMEEHLMLLSQLADVEEINIDKKNV